MEKKVFQAVKRYRQIKKVTKEMNDGAQKFYATSLKSQAFTGFSNYKSKVARKAAASNHWEKSTRARIIRCWGVIARRISSERNQGDQARMLLLKALLKRSIKCWLQLTHQTIQTRQHEVAQASQRFTRSRQQRMLQGWAKVHKEKQSKRLKLAQAAMMHRGLKTAAVTNAWRNYVKAKDRKRERSSMAFSFQRKQALKDVIIVWKAYVAHKERAAAAALKAIEHLKKNLKQKSMAAWRPAHEIENSIQMDSEKTLKKHKPRLQRWACESLLTAGLLLQALRYQSTLGNQPMSSTSKYTKVATLARKWWSLSHRRNNLKKSILPRKEEAVQTMGLQQSNETEPVMQEVLLRIGMGKDGLRIRPERPQSPAPETATPEGRPQPRGRTMLPWSPAAQTLGFSKSGVRQRPQPRRPSFLSEIPSVNSSSIPAFAQ